MLNQEVISEREYDTTDREASEDVVRQRLDILALARELQNVSQACRRAGISRSRFYELKSAFDQYGTEGLAPQPRPKPRMPNQTPPELVEPILNMTARYPTYSYIRVSAKLRASGCEVLPSTVRAVWEQRSLTSCKERLLWLLNKDGNLPSRYASLLYKLSKPKTARCDSHGQDNLVPSVPVSEQEQLTLA
jgi:hypothetical protein